MTRAEWIAEWESKLAELNIEKGAHKPDNGKCVMEAVAYLRGQEHSDRPPCVSPVIGTFMRNWNDSLPNDSDRNRLLKPLIPVIVDTVVSEEVELRRSYMALDWLVRVNAPAWLDLTDNLKAHSVALRGLEPLTDTKSCEKANASLSAAESAARSAAWSAAWSAAGSAAWSAARSAARSALAPTVAALQESASDLVRRMAAER